MRKKYKFHGITMNKITLISYIITIGIYSYIITIGIYSCIIFYFFLVCGVKLFRFLGIE